MPRLHVSAASREECVTGYGAYYAAVPLPGMLPPQAHAQPAAVPAATIRRHAIDGLGAAAPLCAAAAVRAERAAAGRALSRPTRNERGGGCGLKRLRWAARVREQVGCI